jgi:hypothetical protein
VRGTIRKKFSGSRVTGNYRFEAKKLPSSPWPTSAPECKSEALPKVYSRASRNLASIQRSGLTVQLVKHRRVSAEESVLLTREDKPCQKPEPHENCDDSDWPREERRKINAMAPSAKSH